MKKIFTLIAFALTVFMAQAARNDGKLTITHLGYQDIVIEVDGRTYNTNENYVSIDNIAPGNHTVKLYALMGSGNGGGIQRTSRQLLYSGKVRIKPQYHVDIVVNRFGKALVDEMVMDNRYDREYADNNNRGNDRGDGYGRGGRDRGRGDRYQPMNGTAFADMLTLLQRERIDNTRMVLTKQIADQQYFTTSQVKQLLQLYAFESSRLEIAKYLYPKTVDSENYFLVYDVFTFGSTKENLADFIKNYK